MTTYTTNKPFFIKWYMDYFNYDGLATIWNTVYLRDDSKFNDCELIAHEAKHIEQMERDGKIVWFLRYFYYNIRYGYLNNPYEIEARKAQ